MALGIVLSWLAVLGHRPLSLWLSLAARLVLFVALVAWLSRTYGPTAGLIVMVAAVLTRGVLARKRPADIR
jgi:hypothetical protein